MNLLQRVRRQEPALGAALLISAALCVLAYALSGRDGIGLQDEGFVWYGVMRTAHGGVPLRDFRSYDPGRYVWSAAWSLAFGDGLLALRASWVAFQFGGLVAGLLASSRAISQRWLLPVVGALLLAWMYPRWKIIDCSLTLIAVYAALLAFEKPSARRTFAMGAVVGAAAFFGRNHGLYTAVGTFALLALRDRASQRAAFARACVAWALGIVAGYAPMLIMIVAVPGFAGAFADSVAFYLRQPALNAPLPVPWPWTIDFGASANAWSALALGSWFVFLPILSLIAIIVIARARRAKRGTTALLVSASCIGIPYLHHVFVRADVAHLAQGIQPFLLACMAIVPATGRKLSIRESAVVLIAVGSASAFVILPRSPWGRALAPDRGRRELVDYELGSDRIRVAQPMAAHLTQLRAQLDRHVRAESVWLPPDLLALYPWLRREAPVWDIYPAWRADDAAQQRMLDELAGVNWAIAIDPALESEQILHLAGSYPRVWRMFMTDFERVDAQMPLGHWLLHRRGARDAR